ncbi:MAG: cupin domain-containing protein [Actinomycetota bacterium]
MLTVVGGLALSCQTADPGVPEEASATSGASAAEPHFVRTLDEIRWLDRPAPAAFLPKDVKFAFVEGGSPLGPGPFTFRLKFPPGQRLMPHTHPVASRITVISGVLYQAPGRTFDETIATPVAAGGFLFLDAGTPHFVFAREETVIQFHGTGPFGLTYVNPADDPRNTTSD